MNFENVAAEVVKLGCMDFFPVDDHVRLAIAEQLSEMCHSEEEVKWLIKRTIKLFPKRWPGIGEMRAVYCAKYKPKDGYHAYSTAYPPGEGPKDGIPPEDNGARLLEPAKMAPLVAGPAREFLLTAKSEPLKELTDGAPGEPVTASESIAVHVGDLAKMKDLNAVRRLPPKQFPIVQITPGNRITEADCRRALDALHQAQASEEIAAEGPGRKITLAQDRGAA